MLNTSPYLCISYCLQVPAWLELLLWFPSVDYDSGYISQINSFLFRLLLVVVSHHSSGNPKEDRNSVPEVRYCDRPGHVLGVEQEDFGTLGWTSR